MASRTIALKHSYSRSWALLISKSSCSRTYSTEPQAIRAPVLSTGKTKINVWEAQHKQNKGLSPVALSKEMITKLKIRQHVKAADLNRIFDCVTNLDQLALAEQTLHTFRRFSENLPRISLPMIVVRTYIRLQQHYRLLDILKNKKEFGVFPSSNVYNILMDSFYIKSDLKGVLAAYKMIETDSLDPNGDTFLILVHTYCDDSDTKLLDKAIEVTRLCMDRFPRQGALCYHRVIRTLLNRGDSERARQFLDELVRAALPIKIDVNTRLEFFFQLEDYGGAIKHVEAIANSQNLPCPHLGYITKLEEALRQKGLTAELETLKESVSKMESEERGQLTLHYQPQ